MRGYNNYNNYDQYPDYYGQQKPKKSSLDALRMRKFLTFAMVCLFLFCVFIELEIDGDKFAKLDFLKFSKIRLRKLNRKNIESTNRDSQHRNVQDSDHPRSKRDVMEIPTGFIPTWSGEYKVKLFHQSPDFSDWEFHDVTLATQCSANRLHHVHELADRWDGPISIAVFIPGAEASFALDAIAGLKKCYPDTIGKRVSFHLAYPSNLEADVTNRNSLTYTTCTDLLKIIKNYGEDNYDHGIPYPHNVLRNAARNGVATEFVFLIDVDVLPSINLRSLFMDYAGRTGLLGNKHDNRVYVVPVFEIQDGFPVPMTKKALIDANADGMIRPFHNKTCWWCHAPEEHAKWLKLPDLQPKQLSSGFIANWEKSWEPFYIGRRNVPLFDERFKQYGYDRIEQICELHLSGYDFVVLDKAFLVHRGWKEFTKSARQKETYRNWILFNFHFHQMLLRVHKDNKLSCAPIEKWTPKGQTMIDDIANKKAILKTHSIFDIEAKTKVDTEVDAKKIEDSEVEEDEKTL